jgi:serine/threonine protein kinase
MLQQVLHDEPTPPARIQPDVPRDLETICLKCLEKNPSQRYASAAELAEDLERFLAGEAIAAVALSAKERIARLARRDGYRLIAVIGRGPRSITYHALYDAFNQPVTLKVFSSGICKREVWEHQFRQSADLWSAIAHPNVVPVQRAGWWDGAPFLVREYVPHGSLADKLDGRPYPVRQALRLVERLTEVVCYVHRQGVIHGNLKPSNVLLAADDIPRVSDFRLASGLFRDTLLTEERNPIGLGYLTPEMIQDSNAEPRPYTDVYGLGVILYQLLAGRPPFDAATTEEILEQVRHRDPIPPSRLNREVTPPLDTFCLRCLRKNPWRRYMRVYDLTTLLNSFLKDMEGRSALESRRAMRHLPG